MQLCRDAVQESETRLRGVCYNDPRGPIISDSLPVGNFEVGDRLPEPSDVVRAVEPSGSKGATPRQLKSDVEQAALQD